MARRCFGIGGGNGGPGDCPEGQQMGPLGFCVDFPDLPPARTTLGQPAPRNNLVGRNILILDGFAEASDLLLIVPSALDERLDNFFNPASISPGYQGLTIFDHVLSDPPFDKPWVYFGPTVVDQFRYECKCLWSRRSFSTGTTPWIYNYKNSGIAENESVETVPFRLNIGPPRFDDPLLQEFEGFLSGEYKVQKITITPKEEHFSNRVDEQTLRFDSQFWRWYVGGVALSEGNQELFQNAGGETAGLLPLLNFDRTFFDHTCRVVAPFPQEFQSKMAGVSRPAVETHAGVYNYFIERYENIVAPSIDDARFNWLTPSLLPNMYVFLAEKNSQRRSSGTAMSAYHRLITLERRIPNIFVDVLNERGKITERDFASYHEEWSRAISEFEEELRESDLRMKYSNILFSPAEVSLFKAYNEKRFLFPAFVDIEFSTDPTSQVAEALKETQLSISLMRSFLEEFGIFHRQLRIFDQKNFTFVTETVTQETNESPINLTQISQEQNANLIDLREWWTHFSDRGNEIFTNNEFVSIHTDPAEFFQNPTEENRFLRVILSTVFGERLTGIARDKFRNFGEILSGKPAQTETLCYKIEKHEWIDQAPASNPTQTFLIPNLQKETMLRFIDTQVANSSRNRIKRYRYVISAQELIYGTEYEYVPNNPEGTVVVDPNNGRQRILPMVEFGPEFEGQQVSIDVLLKPSLKILDVPLFHFDVSLVDHPPPPPEIDVIPYRNVDNKVLFNLSAGVGVLKALPIIINESDSEKMLDWIIAQNAMTRGDGVELLNRYRDQQLPAIEFRGDDEIDFYEVYRVGTRPTSYADFAENLHEIVDSENYGARNIRSSATSFVDTIQPNKKYYYIVRAIDIHGNFSNPSQVYEVELVNADGAIYPLIRIIYFEPEETKTKFKEFKKYLHIAPAPAQEELTVVNRQDLEDNNLGARDAAVKLGPTDPAVADLFLSPGFDAIKKKYKFRIRSKRSGKMIDINVVFRHEHNRDTDA